MVLLLIYCEGEQNYVFEFKCVNDSAVDMPVGW
jgi:hypothetical protein